MIKKLLACLFVAGATTMGAFAQTDIAGHYVGTLQVTISEADPTPVENQTIGLVKEEGKDTYALSIKDFSFMGMTIGDLDLGGLTTAEEAGVITLNAESEMEGPTVDLGGGATVPTMLMLEAANIMDNNLSLELVVMVGDGVMMVVVEFDGDKQASGIASTEADRFDIFVDDDAITIDGTVESYAIFNTAGTMVQQGAVDNNTIDITGLKGGIYIVKADKHIAKFIKK